MSRKGPGLLLRDIVRGGDPQIDAVIRVIADARPDILALQGFDYDLDRSALGAFAYAIRTAGGPDYPFRFALPSNAGRATDLDLDGDGRTGGPGDAQGYGAFFGAGAMAILSRHPVIAQDARDFSNLLWTDLPGAIPPVVEGTPFPSSAAQRIQRLSSSGHWIVPIKVPELGRLDLLTFHAAPPVFDGPEDRNGRRNHDEVMFWHLLLEGKLTGSIAKNFVLLGDANLDPHRGDGRRVAIARLLSHPKIQDPMPNTPTVIWEQTGPMRVDYLLPSISLTVIRTGHQADPEASRHALVWADLRR